MQKLDKFFAQNSIVDFRIVIMTIGDVFLSDDGIGPMIYKELAFSGLKSESILLINAELRPGKQLKKIIEFNPTHVIIIDAIESNLEPGTVLVFDNDKIDEEIFLRSSDQKVSLLNINNQLIENLDVKLLNIGIQVKSTKFGFQILDSEVYECGIRLKNYLSTKLTHLFSK